MSLSGDCECGAAAYTIASASVHIYACHCLNCQTRSGSAFALHAMLPAAIFDCKGATETYCRSANGIAFEEVFCSTCHTRLFNRNDMLPEMIFLRPGTLAASPYLEPMAHIWVKRKQPWIVLPAGIPTFDESPAPEEFGAAIRAADQRAKG